MEEDQYEDDTAAVNDAINRAFAKLLRGLGVLVLLALVFSVTGILP